MQEEGVTFQSPVDGQQLLLTPERSTQIQNDIGANIMMALDDVVSSVCEDHDRFQEATHRTLRWIDRCIDPLIHRYPIPGTVAGLARRATGSGAPAGV